MHGTVMGMDQARLEAYSMHLDDIDVSQPEAFGRGDTIVAPVSTVSASTDGSRMFLFEGGTSLGDIVRAVNAVGAAPGDIVAILEALKQAGALRAELEVI